jgi:hypothetical protein
VTLPDKLPMIVMILKVENCLSFKGSRTGGFIEGQEAALLNDDEHC